MLVYLAPLAEVEGICGQDALACYDPSRSVLVSPGDDPNPTLSAEAVMTHEYGHHVANHRANPPFKSIAYGSKRWASYVNVCAQTKAGRLFPDNDPRHYRLNPGEGYAESDRVLSQRRLGRPESPWLIVERSLYPDQGALNALAADVTSPWTQNTVRALSAAARPRAAVRRHAIATPLDGTLNVNVTVPRTLAAQVSLLAAGRVVTAAKAAGGRARLSLTVCGLRAYTLAVRTLRGRGRYRAAVATP